MITFNRTQSPYLMKNTLLIASMLLAAGAQAQVLESGFESWTDGDPDGWAGSKTHSSNIAWEEVTADVHGGSSALRLITTGSDHRRFATQPLTVTNGTEYTVTFWVRGAGQVRVGLFDNRATGSGYSSYTDYSTATTTWTQVSHTVTAVMDVDIAEFILSVRNSVAPEHIVIDDVAITAGGSLQEVSINAIQLTSDPGGASTYDGQLVSTSGIVTGTYLTYSGEPPAPQFRYTYLQDGSGPWNGIVIFDYANNNNVANIGDALTVVATVSEFNGLTELTGLQSFNITATGQPSPEPLVIESGEVASEALESVLVKVVDATCTVVPSGATFGKWNVDDGSGDAVIGKLMHTATPAPVLGQVFDVTGVVSFTNYNNVPEWNIQPRVAADIALSTGIREAGVLGSASLFPNPATDRLTLDLGKAAGQRVEYTLTDAQGRMVRADVVNDTRTDLNVTGLNAGVYHLTLRTDKLVHSLPVFVVR